MFADASRSAASGQPCDNAPVGESVRTLSTLSTFASHAGGNSSCGTYRDLQAREQLYPGTIMGTAKNTDNKIHRYSANSTATGNTLLNPGRLLE